jgi:hypothetical protein
MGMFCCTDLNMDILYGARLPGLPLAMIALCWFFIKLVLVAATGFDL